jgi:signal transduction histidine kinase/CheY-like chemotaxis protein
MHMGLSVPLDSPPPNMSGRKAFFVHEHGAYFEFYGPVFSIRESEDFGMFEESAQSSLLKEHIGWVRIGLSKEVMKETARNLIWNSALFALLLVAVAIAFVIVLLNVVLRPLSTLFAAAKDLQEGEYPQVPLIDTGDEIGQLSAEFNKMTLAIKDREQQLMYSQQRIGDLFERVEHAIFRLDSNFKVIEGNRRFAELCEHEADFFCLVPEEERDSLLKAAIAGELAGAEVVIIGRDGHRHTIFLSVYPEIGEDGSISGFDGHFVDITEKKMLEETLHQTQKLESLGLLAGGVAHDFNNILTTILGYSEITMMALSKDDPLRERIEAIYDAGGRAAALTRQLLAFSRKQVMEMKVINLNTSINDMAKMLGRLIGENIEMKLLTQSPVGNIKADPGQVEQIIMNLAVNARDAMRDGGSLFFETDSVELDEEYCLAHPEISPGSYVMLIVTDTGQGMTPEVREKIFDPFFTTKAKGEGTGLGLSTVYGIVKQHKGYIYVYSELGSGTTFKIYFPEEKSVTTEEMAAKKPQAMQGGTETVLVVDDEPSILRLVADTLQPLGYHMLEAACGEDAVEIVINTDRKIDLLLTDVIMPGMSGKDLAEKVGALRPDMKVVFMSGYTDNVIVHQGVLEPGVLFINKPLLPSLLTRKIREILDNI